MFFIVIFVFIFIVHIFIHGSFFFQVMRVCLKSQLLQLFSFSPCAWKKQSKDTTSIVQQKNGKQQKRFQCRKKTRSKVQMVLFIKSIFPCFHRTSTMKETIDKEEEKQKCKKKTFFLDGSCNGSNGSNSSISPLANAYFLQTFLVCNCEEKKEYLERK